MVSSTLAQTYVKEGKLYVHTNSKVTIKGEVHNKGTITNQGILSVTGGWKNAASYVSSGGTIALNGTDTQIFSHNNQSVDILTIANPTDVRLASNVTVEDKLILQKGVVTPETDVKLMLTEKAEVQGGSPNAYIDGKMYHTGLGSKFYPIGKNGQYAPVTLTQVDGEHPVVGVEFYDQGLHTYEESDIQLQEFYWNFSSLSERFEGSPVALDILIPDAIWQEEDNLIIAGSDNLEENFKTLALANVQMQGKRYIFSSNLPIRSQYITLGIQERIKEFAYIPNALSPFAPHPEDRTIKIYSKHISPEGFQWTIWDNWGHVVYTTNSHDQASTTGWQGTLKGKGEALPGIYKYLLQGTLNSGQTFSKTGNIVLYK